MSTVKLSGLPELTTADNNDILLITDTDAATSKKITKSNLLNGYLTSYTETDPVVGAVTGIVKADGAGNISAAVAGTDYLASYTETDPVVGAVTGIVKADGAGNISAAVAGTDYLASYTETNDLTSAVTWANIPDANVPESAVTQHEAALSITEGQISDLGSDIVLDSDIGVTVQAYDADTAKYDDTTANFTGTLQNGGSAVVTAAYTGDVDITGEFTADSYNESYAAVTSTSNATTIDCEAGNTFMHTLTENTTFTFSNPPTSGTAYTMSIEIIQDSTDRTITWPASVDWPAATAPTISSGSGAVDVFVFTTRDGGTTWYGFTAGQAIA